MNKTNLIVLAVAIVYIIIIMPKSKADVKRAVGQKESEKADTESGTDLAENPDKNGVSQGASGQQKYRIGYTK